MSQNYLEISYLKGSLIFGAALLLSSCSSTATLNKNSIDSAPTTPMKVFSTPLKQATTIKVDWQNVEAIAEQYYQNKSIDELVPNGYLKWDDNSLDGLSYAKEFNVSLAEARRRLTLMSLSSKVMSAVEEDLGEASLMSYYINDDPNEFRVGVNTLNTVLAERYVYKFKHSGSTDYSLPIYIYPISDKTLAQINQLIADAKPEVLKRYPYTWLNHYDPVKNAVDIYISFHPSKLPNEIERQAIETELTNLIGYQVALKVNIATYSYRE